MLDLSIARLVRTRDQEPALSVRADVNRLEQRMTSGVIRVSIPGGLIRIVRLIAPVDPSLTLSTSEQFEERPPAA